MSESGNVLIVAVALALASAYDVPEIRILNLLMISRLHLDLKKRIGPSYDKDRNHQQKLTVTFGFNKLFTTIKPERLKSEGKTFWPT